MNNSDTYNSIAEEIVSNSIKKAVFIDDDATLPFSKESISDEFCSNLFNSFLSNNSVIDFFQYSKGENVNEKILSGRNDLIILDWELSKATPKYADTLEIIKAVISNESPHFLCIYTNEKSEAFQDIIIKIKAHLNSYILQLTCEFYELQDYLDTCGLEFDVFSSRFNEQIKNYLLSEQSEEIKIKKEIDTELKKFLNDYFDDFQIKFSDFRKFCFNCLGFSKEESEKVFYTNVYKENNCIVANNTIILLVQKGEIEPENFIPGFSKSVLNIPHSYLTLVSLEYRNKFLEQSSFLGKELQKISENAFYHHMIELGPEFEDFIRELWKYDNTSFLNAFKSKIIETFESFKKTNDVENKIKKDGELFKELAKLNSYYNIAPKLFNKGKLLFGDIFTIKNISNKVLLCITAHCDCLRPQKIKNNFFFIQGDIIELKKKHLEEADSDFKSFIIQNDKPIVINWGACKPFTLYVSDESNTKESSIKVLMNNEKIELNYLCTLKENYTQRIANNAFVNASRVGISFAKIPE